MTVQTLVQINHTPAWIQEYLRDIETGCFGEGYARLDPAAELVFGSQAMNGRDEIYRFFNSLIKSVIIRHKIEEVWDGSDLKMLRGQLVVSKREEPLTTISPPIVIFLTVSHSKTIIRVVVVVGPVQAIHSF